MADKGLVRNNFRAQRCNRGADCCGVNPIEMHFMCLKAGIIKDAEGSFIYKQRGGPMLPAFLLPWRYFPSNKNGAISLGW